MIIRKVNKIQENTDGSVKSEKQCMTKSRIQSETDNTKEPNGNLGVDDSINETHMTVESLHSGLNQNKMKNSELGDRCFEIIQ